VTSEDKVGDKLDDFELAVSAAGDELR